MPRTLVGLIGKKRSGKDTFASGLTRMGFTRYAFADPLKALMLDLDPLVQVEQDEMHLFRGTRLYGWHVMRLRTIVDEIGWERAKEIREVRRLLQDHGDGVRRHVGGDVWLSATMEEVLRDPGNVVVTDVRYPNEADAIRAHGGTLVRIIRPGLTSDDHHVTETALDDYPTHFVVSNGGTAAEFGDYAASLARLGALDR